MSRLYSVLGTSGGGGQRDFVETIPGSVVTGASTLAANTAYGVKVRVAAPVPVASVSIFVTTASGNVDAGIYESDGTTLTRKASSGSVAAAGAGAEQVLAMTAGTVMIPGRDYYVFVSVDNGTVSIHRVLVNATISGIRKRVVSIGSSFPLPATIALSGVSGSGSCVLAVTNPS